MNTNSLFTKYLNKIENMSLMDRIVRCKKIRKSYYEVKDLVRMFPVKIKHINFYRIPKKHQILSIFVRKRCNG